jgi:hypothetical protein
MAEPVVPPWAPQPEPEKKHDGGYFAKVPIGMYQCGLSPSAIVLYGWLSARYGGYRNGINPAVATLAADLRWSVSKVQRCRAELCAAGWLTMTQRQAPNGREATNVYTLTLNGEDAARLRKGQAKAQARRGRKHDTPAELPWKPEPLADLPREAEAQVSRGRKSATPGVSKLRPENKEKITRDSLLLEEEAREADGALADARAHQPSLVFTGEERPPSAVQDRDSREEDEAPAEDEKDEGARGRCSGCGEVGPHEDITFHVLRPCPDWLALYRRDPAAALDPGTEYEQWQCQPQPVAAACSAGSAR